MDTPSFHQITGPVVFLFCLALQTANADLPAKKTDAATYRKQAAYQIDKAVAGFLKASKKRPNAKSTDAQYLRRTYLNIIGRIPTHEEAITFLDDQGADKRKRLVDQLLASPGYVSHQFNFWADLLRAKSDLPGQREGHSYLRWLRKITENNRPYDEVVHTLLTASGAGWSREPDSGAVGYYERDRGMPLDNMANTTRIFLGTHMACAQCHNHPYDEWKQSDFFEMAAFTHGLKRHKDEKEIREIFRREEENDLPNDLRRVANLVRYSIHEYGIRGGGDGIIPLPEDYQYNDADPGEKVRARALFGKKRARNSRNEKIDDGRERFATWVTSPENEQFTKVISNRLWKRVMGVGVFEPVDELSPRTKVSNPKLLDALCQIMQKVDYDLKEFQRILYTTRTYDFATSGDEHDPGQAWAFNGRPLQRLSAEQVWDSLVSLTVPDADLRRGSNTSAGIRFRNRFVLTGKKDYYDLYDETIDLGPDEFWAYVKQLKAYIEADLAKNKRSGRKKNGSDAMMMTAGGPVKGLPDDRRWEGFSRDWMRASELPSPTRPGHFLRRFGQSGREVIDGATREMDVTQVLSLLNGQIEKMVLKDNSKILKDLKNIKDNRARIETAFLAILSRKPSAEETAVVEKEFVSGSSFDTRALLWSLANTSEFMFIQ
ncbi:MAG: DUF1549 domain-containing protein [Verrucomicrobiota bacterium]